MKLRELEEKDAKYMLEWMHDKDIVEYLATDFRKKTLDDCLHFIHMNDKKSYHRAIVNDFDEYMGTISLKNISNSSAEFAISVRKCAMGSGYAGFAMHEILDYGINTLGLKIIYWCVSCKNKRAIRFYEKNGYNRCNYFELPPIETYTKEQIESYYWYKVISDEYAKEVGTN